MLNLQISSPLGELYRPALLASAVILCLVGCGGPSAMEQRMAEFAYTPDSLAKELIERLKTASDTRKRARAQSSRGEKVREMESDRGIAEDRPDPFAVESIVPDAATKLRGILDRGDHPDAQSQVITAIENAPSLDSEVTKEFVTGLGQAMSAPATE